MACTCGRCQESSRFWIGDTFLVLFLFFPTMVFYWRGIWDLVGVYIFPDDELKQCWTIIGFGSGTIFGYALHPVMDVTLRSVSRNWRFVLTRVYMAVYAVLPMAYWRGVWTAADYYLDQYGWQAGLIGYLICEVVLISSRVRKTAIFPPLFVPLDTDKDVLKPNTRFRIKPSVTWQYGLDALFSHFIALTFTILLWRGAWECVDHFFIPHDYILSNYWSIGLGYASSLGILLLDPLLLKVARWISNRDRQPGHQFVALLAWEYAVYLVAFWCHLFAWRGAWNLNAEYIIKDHEIGGWVNNLVGTVGFLVLQTYSYVGACGCVVDGHIDGKQDRWFPTNYLTTVVPYFRESKNCCGGSSDDSDASSLDESKEVYVVGEDNLAFSQNQPSHLTEKPTLPSFGLDSNSVPERGLSDYSESTHM